MQTRKIKPRRRTARLTHRRQLQVIAQIPHGVLTLVPVYVGCVVYVYTSRPHQRLRHRYGGRIDNQPAPLASKIDDRLGVAISSPPLNQARPIRAPHHLSRPLGLGRRAPRRFRSVCSSLTLSQRHGWGFITFSCEQASSFHSWIAFPIYLLSQLLSPKVALKTAERNLLLSKDEGVPINTNKNIYVS